MKTAFASLVGLAILAVAVPAFGQTGQRPQQISSIADTSRGAIQDFFANNLHAENISADHGSFSTLASSASTTSASRAINSKRWWQHQQPPALQQ